MEPRVEPRVEAKVEPARCGGRPLRFVVVLASAEAVSKEELILSLRRHSKGFSRGSSKYRGVTRHQKARTHSEGPLSEPCRC